jgi:cyclohexadienyl dehydratase
MSGDYAPFCRCPDVGKECEGFEVEAARRLAVDLGVRLAIIRFRWPELRQDLEAGKFDVAMSGITMRPERLLFASFTRPYAVTSTVVLVKNTKRFSSLAAVNQPGVRLAVNAGAVISSKLLMLNLVQRLFLSR